jgi:glycosyltransferase involved in cell wall biosynthesis
MRVLHLIKNFDFGGAENHVRELANSLDELDHKVYIVAGKGRQVNLLNKSVRFIPLHLKDSLMIFQICFICYFSLKNRIQIIHAHQRLPILMASIVGKITGIPVVVTVHGRTSHDLRSWISRKYSGRIIFVSKHVLEVSARYNRIKHKSVIIPNGVSKPNDKFVKCDYSISYISRMDKKHSAVILLMIQKVIPNLLLKYPMITFKIIGEGDCLSEIIDEVTLLNRKLNRNVCLVCGFIPDVKELIQQSELVMGVGRVAQEALACGVPALSINLKHMGSIISADNYSLYRNNNFIAVENIAPTEKKLFDVLNNFFTDLRLWQKESLILQKYVNEDFSPIKISSAIAKLYYEFSESGGM